MAKRRALLTLGSVLILALGVNCSSEEDGSDDSSGNGNGANPNDPSGVPASQSDEIRDIDGDGELDPLTAEDFGAAGVPVTEQDIENQRNSACTGWVAEPEPLGASLFLVVDASSSMEATAPGTGNLSKWEATRDALIEAVNNLSDDTAAGLLAYPNKVVDGTTGDPNMCVNIDALTPLGVLGSGHRATLVEALNAVETNVCTPTHDAYIAAVESFATTPAPGQKYMMLMTDGQPTLTRLCNPTGDCRDSPQPEGAEEEVMAEISAAFQTHGIKTFVLGAPGSEEHSETGLDNRWWLSQSAELGGTSPGNCFHDAEPYCHFDMTGEGVDFVASLRQALRDIVGQVVACDYAIPVPPEGETIDLNAINLYLYPDGNDPIQILRTEGPDCEQGWYYDATTELVMLCPLTCALAQSDPNAKAELMFGCESDVILPE